LLVVYIICALLFLSCDKPPAPYVSGRPSPTIEVEQNDKEIERITENARRALPIFFRNLASPEKGMGNFFVKYPLSSDNGGVEQVWLGGIRFKNNAYYGTLANTANSPVKKKDIIIDTDNITDWMYIQDGKIIGGQSIKHLLEKIPEGERSEDQRKILRMFD